MLSQLIHNFFDGTLNDAQKEQVLGKVWSDSAAMNEFHNQKRLHEAIEADKAAMQSASHAEEDLQAIFGKVGQQKNTKLPLPFVPFADANAPQISFGDTSSLPLQSGFMSAFAEDKPPAKQRRNVVPLFSKFALQALTFCGVGAVAATFGVMPIAKDSVLPERFSQFRNQPQNITSESALQTSIGKDFDNSTHQVLHNISTNHPVNGDVLRNDPTPRVFISDSTQKTPIGVEPLYATKSPSQSEFEADAEIVQDCPMKGAKPISWLLDEPQQQAAAMLEVTRIPRTRQQQIKQPFKQHFALTTRMSKNISPNGFAASIGGLFTATERDAFGMEIGGAFDRAGYRGESGEYSSSLASVGYAAALYRFNMPVENIKFAGFSQVRLGVESTGAVFAGLALGVQYQLTDILTMFASAEASRTLLKPASADNPFNLSHDGVSLGLAVKL